MKVIMAARSVYPFYHGYSGSPKYVYYLARQLARQGINIEIVAPTVDAASQKSEILDGVRYTLFPYLMSGKKGTVLSVTRLPTVVKRLGDVWWQRLFSRRVARYLRQQDFDILHSYDTVPYAYLHQQNRRPVVYQPFGNEGFTIPAAARLGLISRLYHRALVQPMWRYCGSHAEVVVAEGDFQIEEMTQLYGIGRERVQVLPVAVDSAYIRGRVAARNTTRQQVGLGDGDFVLLTANTLNPEKGVRYLVDAFSLVKQKAANARLIIIGTGPEEDRLKNQIRDCGLSGAVIHLKNVPEESLYDYFALSDVYVSPTLQTDFILGILEAEVCGLPIVSTGQDWLIRQGANGFVVPQKDPSAMAAAILQVYTSDRKVMGLASREIAGDYDFYAVARRAIEIYEKL